MTREEAISRLEQGAPFSEIFDKSWEEALDMAISALKGFEGMTNGEVIQALFPNTHIDTRTYAIWVGHDDMSFTRAWWNTPYKAERED